MKLLGIDYGDKRIGLAIATDGWISPYGAIRNTLMIEVIRKIKLAVQKEEIDKIILGLPQTFSRHKNLQIKKVEYFAQQLKKNLKIPVEFESEIFTTKLAQNSLGRSPQKTPKSHIDAKAAAFILETYLQRDNS